MHEWAYLPDFAAAFVALADNLHELGFYEALHFPGHAVTDLEIKAAAEKALGRPLQMTSMPWWVLRAGSPFLAMWREIVSMSYLRFEPHRLASARLGSVIGRSRTRRWNGPLPARCMTLKRCPLTPSDRLPSGLWQGGGHSAALGRASAS